MLSHIASLDEYASCLRSVRVPMSRIENSLTRQCGIDWHMARLDLLDDGLSGNKLFKLLPFLLQARAEGQQRLLSFGGMHSNHLHALAVAGKRFGFSVVAVVRGYAAQPETPTLHDLRLMGAEIVFADRATYSRRYDAEYLQSMLQQYPDVLVIPEGGAGAAGVEGGRLLGCLLAEQLGDNPYTLALAMGTGTTFLGLLTAGAFGEQQTLLGYSALKNAAGLRDRALSAVAGLPGAPIWHITDEFCGGGFARLDARLALFMRDFENEQCIPLDPVYTGKLCHAVSEQLGSGRFPAGTRIITLHTGGLQGRRGMQNRLGELAPADYREPYINHA